MKTIINIGKISSRGQIAIPAEVRRALNLEEGEKILFMLEGDTLTIRKIKPSKKSWEELTKPLREAVKKSNLKEEDIVNLIHKFRKEKKK